MAVTPQSWANLPYWNLLPMMVTHFGGDTQVCTIDMPSYGYTSGFTLNPLAQSIFGCGYNPYSSMYGSAGLMNGYMGNPYTFNPFASGIFGCGYNPYSSYTNPDTIYNMAQMLVTPVLNDVTNQNINQIDCTISCTKARLNAKLQDSKTTDEQKAQIEDMLAKLKEQEDKLNEIKNSNNLDAQTAYRQVTAIQSDVNALVKEILSNLNKMTSSSVDDNSNDTDNQNVQTQQEHQEQETTIEDSHKDDKKPADNTTLAGSKTNSPTVTQSKSSSDINDLITKFYWAVFNKRGTDTTAMEEVLNAINEDNVMDVMDEWNSKYLNVKNRSFMKTFMRAKTHKQEQAFCNKIVELLYSKAKKLGIYESCADDFTKIFKKIRRRFIPDNVYKNYDNIIAKIKAKENEVKAEPSDNSDKQET